MATAPSFPTYKWWETDDKTKRLYTELLAEKLSSPRKSSSTTLSRKPSNGKDARSQLTSSPKHDIPKVNFSCGERNSRKSKEEKGEGEDKSGKYTFETITIDTLAKYEYIKSPRKRAASTAPVSFFESTEKPDDKGVIKAASSGYMDNKEVIEKLLPTSKDDKPTPFSNGQFLISQKFASKKSEWLGLKNDSDEKDASKKEALMKKDKPSRAKLMEIPEYTSSDSSESSADETVLLGASKAKKTVTPVKSKEPQDNKKTGEVDKPLKIEELSTKFQFLTEEVAQLEFKMFEFSDDIKKLKQAIGIKDTKPENYEKEKTSTKQPTVVKTNEFGITRSKSFTHAERFNSKALLMKRNASPSKMLAAKTGGLLSEEFPLEGTSKEDAMAELKKNGALIEIINKIKVQEFSEDEIQEILRCAKDKYVNKPC